VVGIGLGGFVLLLLVIILVSTSITRPLKNLAGRTAEIAKGNLAADLRDEGLTSVTVKKEPRNVTVTANVAGKLYTQTPLLKYTAKQGKTGSAKK